VERVTKDSAEWKAYQNTINAQVHSQALARYDIDRREFERLKADAEIEISKAREYQDRRDENDRNQYEKSYKSELANCSPDRRDMRLGRTQEECLKEVNFEDREGFAARGKLLLMDWSTKKEVGKRRSYVNRRAQMAKGPRKLAHARELDRSLGVAWLEKAVPTEPVWDAYLEFERARIVEMGEAGSGKIWVDEKGDRLAEARRAAFEKGHQWVNTEQAQARALAELQGKVSPDAWEIFWE
jgi:hypothetical protein